MVKQKALTFWEGVLLVFLLLCAKPLVGEPPHTRVCLLLLFLTAGVAQAAPSGGASLAWNWLAR